jgi:antitoxin component YwqK of YwqJK toxin-antitoxin module
MKYFSTILFIAIIIFACNTKNDKTVHILKKVNSIWLDSIVKNSDSNYSKDYKREDFVTAAYNISKKDSSICQVMSDSAKQIRQIIIAKNGKRIYFAQYYANGQQIMDVKLDSFGQYNDSAFTYYENGVLKTEGKYNHGFSIGQWKVYDENGNLKNVLNYDSSGALIK